jgi:hypothetical protein
MLTPPPNISREPQVPSRPRRMQAGGTEIKTELSAGAVGRRAVAWAAAGAGDASGGCYDVAQAAAKCASTVST